MYCVDLRKSDRNSLMGYFFLPGGMVGPPVIGSVIGNLVGERVGDKTTRELGLDRAAGQVGSNPGLSFFAGPSIMQ